MAFFFLRKAILILWTYLSSCILFSPQNGPCVLREWETVSLCPWARDTLGTGAGAGMLRGSGLWRSVLSLFKGPEQLVRELLAVGACAWIGSSELRFRWVTGWATPTPQPPHSSADHTGSPFLHLFCVPPPGYHQRDDHPLDTSAHIKQNPLWPFPSRIRWPSSWHFSFLFSRW